MFSIPENKLPEFLKDEQRVNVLFAPLRTRSANSKDWDSKISAWKTIIKVYCEVNDIYSFTLSSLNNVFIRNGRPPSCLEEVIKDMAQNNEVQIVDIFFRKTSDTWSGWVTDVLIKRPASWSFNKIKNTVFTVSNKEETFVHLEVVKNKCEQLLDVIPDKFKNKLISLKDLLVLMKTDLNNVENTKLLLHHLSNNSKVDVTRLNSNKNDELNTLLIKFGDGHKVVPINETDIGIYTLEQNEKLLSKNVEVLEDEIEACVKEAKGHLAKNHRQLAKSSLRKKHELEKRLDKKLSALHNIQTLLEQIHDTHSDVHVWDAYKHALSAFNTTFKDTGMSEDTIEDTMIKLGDMLDKHEDIQSALARPALETTDLDLEDELAELLKEDSKNPPPDGGLNTSDIEKEMEKLNINLPDVPESSPEVSLQELPATQ